LAGKLEKMPGAGPLGPVSPKAASEICDPRPAKDARPPDMSAAVTTNPRPASSLLPVPVGCRSLAGWPCSAIGASAAAAISTTSRRSA
jgi:hypothetical protein